MPTLLDTHAWVWWVTADRRLSGRAARAIRRAAAMNDASISAISIWEVAKRVEKRQLVLDRPVQDWIAHAMTMKGLAVAELTPGILVDSCNLPPPFHGDPADQMIVASARRAHAVLVTRDRKLRDYPHVQTIW